MAAGAPIRELNALRTSTVGDQGRQARRELQGARDHARVSDVIGDDPRVIGSGPTIAVSARIQRPQRGHRADASSFADGRSRRTRCAPASGSRSIREPLCGDVATRSRRISELGVRWGEPTVACPRRSRRGRPRAAARARARAAAARAPTAARSAPAATASMARRRRADPRRRARTSTARPGTRSAPRASTARTRSRAAMPGSALAAVGALVITGPTGINHARSSADRRVRCYTGAWRPGPRSPSSTGRPSASPTPASARRGSRRRCCSRTCCGARARSSTPASISRSASPSSPAYRELIRAAAGGRAGRVPRRRARVLGPAALRRRERARAAARYRDRDRGRARAARRSQRAVPRARSVHRLGGDRGRAREGAAGGAIIATDVSARRRSRSRARTPSATASPSASTSALAICGQPVGGRDVRPDRDRTRRTSRRP